ncbi:MAG: efflux RND transporter periplasmic adaptor subunit [Deltaproteobacteria bacterium]|nr:efflux RND transporter periplasmic adaptor subunit [Deltaproteobacteria bacterium]
MEQETKVIVEVVPVREGEIAKVVEFAGSIAAEAEVKIYPQITAMIKDIMVEIGDSVQKGDVMALLDSEELEAQFAQAKAALDVIKAKWAQMETGARPEEIAQTEDLVTKAKAALKEAESNFNRSKEMIERGTISERQFESSEIAYTIAKADLSSAQERLKMLKEGATKEDRDALQAQVRQAEAAVESARVRLSYARITSPFKGTISERFFEPGDLAMPGKPLFTIVQMDQVKVVISFQENQIQYLKEGLSAYVRVAAYGDHEYTGKIERISPTLNPQTRMFTAEILLDNKRRILRPGMFASVKFFIDPHTNALLVPKEAIVFSEGIHLNNLTDDDKNPSGYIFIVEGETAQKREVIIGHTSGEIVEIKEGVKIGDKVVTRGLFKLKDGDRVKVVEQGGVSD